VWGEPHTVFFNLKQKFIMANVKTTTTKSSQILETSEEKEPVIRYGATIETVSDEIKIKNGSGREYVVCTVLFNEGPLEGKTFFAQRTLGIDSKGREKTMVTVGQKVSCIAEKGVDAEGNTRPYFEISTGTSVTDASEILALLGW
jgi:hypothetical protein